ncbi:unnamed protein product [Periconia digitata]|uniref:Uncharacterized protein n=1 Tax=Periconia digitata TaxID=1303443 RepID=A0A9W4USR9_9PLEO|nr:unnamed protein product [Periconia digitata]
MEIDLPTPPASSIAASPLPQPRRRPLTRGSPKESQLISYLDKSLNDIRKKIDNRGVETGYISFSQIARDIEGIVDVVWVSGSPTLQTPYLLTISTLTIDALPLFPPSSTHAFALLDKLDAAFSSLLAGRDIDSGAALPGFDDGRRGLSTTDKVRIKGVVERMRVVVFKVVAEEDDGDADKDVGGSAADGEENGGERGRQDGDGDGTVSFEGFENNDDDGADVDGAAREGEGDHEEEEEDVETLAARVFEKTLAELGDVLGGEPIGIITEE